MSDTARNTDEDLALLRPRERAFVLAYTGPCFGNGSAAARAAGYSGNRGSSRVQACAMLARPKVRAASR